MGLSRVASFRQSGRVNGVTHSLLFCRRLETKFECMVPLAVCAVRGSVVRQFHNFSNSNPGLAIQVTCR